MQDYEIISNCLLCNSDLTQFLHLTKSPLANEFSEYGDYIQDDEFNLTLMKCINCNHIQLDTIVNPERLFRDYLYVSSTSSVNREHFKKYAHSIIKKFNLQKQDQTLEIGSNDGLFLSFMKEKGLQVLGVDPARNIAKEATLKGIPTVPEFFTIQLAKDLIDGKKIAGSTWTFYEQTKIVVANHIFAHTKDLKEIVNGVLEVLADDGVFIFENSYLGDMLDKCLVGTIYSEHIHMHHLSPLIKFFRKLGMKVFDIERLTEQQGGSFRVFVCKNSAKYKVEQSVFDMLEEEKQIPEKLSQFKNKIENWKKETLALLNKYKSEGKVIDIFGYPAKLSTELFTLGVDKNIFRHAYEDAELKIGKFSPGLHIEIVSPEYIIGGPFDADIIYIGAWNFASSIIEKCKQMEYKGKFIVPLPELKVIE